MFASTMKTFFEILRTCEKGLGDVGARLVAGPPRLPQPRLQTPFLSRRVHFRRELWPVSNLGRKKNVWLQNS